MLPTLAALVPSFRRHLLAGNKSPRTVTTYLAAVTALERFLDAQGLPTEAASVKRHRVESFLVDRMERYRPASVSVEFRALQQFWRWATEEGCRHIRHYARVRAREAGHAARAAPSRLMAPAATATMTTAAAADSSQVCRGRRRDGSEPA